MTKMRFAILSTLLGTASAANAAMVEATYKTTFDGGHRAEGTIIYDNTLPVVTANTSGPTDGIEFLDVTFFDADNNELYSVVDIAGGVSSYSFLTIEFDTALPNFVPGSSFDIGMDFSIPGEYFMHGNEGGVSSLFEVTASSIDSANPTSFTVTIVPEPFSLAILSAGFPFLFCRNRLLSITQHNTAESTLFARLGWRCKCASEHTIVNGVHHQPSVHRQSAGLPL